MKSILADNIIRVSAAFTLLIVSFCLTGCQKEDSTSFTATTQRYEAPKLHIGSNIAYWDNNDRVAINDGTYAVSIDGNDNKATIAAEGVTPYGNEYYAAYPAEYAKIGIDGTIVFNLPSTEIYSNTTSGSQHTHNLMVAKTDNNHLAFENVGAMLHFRLKGSGDGIGQKLVAIEVSTDKPLCGKLTVNQSGDSWNTSLSYDASDTARLLTFTTPYLLTNSYQDFYLFIPEVNNASHFRLQYVIESGSTVKVFNAIKFATTSFVKGHIYNFGENDFNGSSIQINNSTSIDPLTMDGTNEHPYLVSSNTLWQTLSSELGTANKNITLVNDITVDSRITTLRANLDGNGHTITLNNNISLFENIDGCTVSNLTLEGNVTNPTCSNNHYGALACNVTGGATIEKCINKTSIECFQGKKSSATEVGGLCGYVGGSSLLINCENKGTIRTDARYIGGIAGFCNTAASVNGCKNSNNIIIEIASSESEDIFIGGLFGYVSISNTTSPIIAQNCNNTGNISISGSTNKNIFCGGIFGQISSGSSFSVEDCRNIGTISITSDLNRNRYIGGIAGTDGSNSSNMINCFNEGSISCNRNMYAGGLLGYNRKMSIQNCFAFCNITANTSSTYSSAAGLVAYGGDLSDNPTITNCYFFGTLSNNIIYGIAGESRSDKHMNLDHCYYPDDITTICGTNTNADNTCGTMSSATDNTTLNNLNSEANSHPDYNHWTTGYNGLESLHIIFQN